MFLKDKSFYFRSSMSISYLFLGYMKLLYFERYNFDTVIFINTSENKFHIVSGRSHARRGRRLLPAVAR